MLQQPLYHSSRNAVLSKDRTKRLAEIMEFEIKQSKLIAYLRPSVLAERTAEQPFLFRVKSSDVFLQLCHDKARETT